MGNDLDNMQKDDNGLLPCPFCGSRDIRLQLKMYCDDDGEHPGIECLNCDAMNRLLFWNLRPSKTQTCPHHPDCECLDYCEHLDPHSTPTLKRG